MKVNLGDRVKDKITGFKGIVVGITYWLNGCVRAGVQMEKMKKGESIQTEWIDDVQLEVLKHRIISFKPPGPSGPRKNATRAANPTR